MQTLFLDRLGFSRQGRKIMHDLTLRLHAGQMVSILGANGAGKTTLLRLILGLLHPDSGQVLIDGSDLRHLQRKRIAQLLAYVPQNRDILPPYPVARIVELGGLPHGSLMKAPSEQDNVRAEAAMTQLGLFHLRDRPCNMLSGGEYQRVLLARMLVQNAPVLVLDEPLSGLDYGQQIRLMALLASFAKEGRLVIMTAHQPDLVYRYASHVVLLADGRVLAEGEPQIVLDATPLSAFYDVALRHYDHDGQRFFMGSEQAE
ncbi:ABC transporter ATP-binding protein [Asaia prunellae]|uniref:ABC transporter ATP-binding protein n=1 Tax=Asaia prunellae TaxID=610245 RepID=UPI00046E6898|nr:ABC transporter ATP-binding protein [Asaia prunellae]